VPIEIQNWHSNHKTTGVFIVRQLEEESAAECPLMTNTPSHPGTAFAPSTPTPAVLPAKSPSAATGQQTTQIPPGYPAAPKPTATNPSLMTLDQLTQEIDRLRINGKSWGFISTMAGYSGKNGLRDIETFLKHVQIGKVGAVWRLQQFQEQLRLLK
jgi:hypothetical protein